jgi:ABC-type phosphate transport system substrate-binding protein
MLAHFAQRPFRRCLVFVVCVFWPMMPSADAADGAPILVAHPDVPVEALDSRDVKKIFLGEKTRWENQQRIYFITLKNPEVHESFLQRHVGKTPTQYDIFWKKRVFSGRGRMPEAVDSAPAVMEYVSRNPGSIGYLPPGTPLTGGKQIQVR